LFPLRVAHDDLRAPASDVEYQHVLIDGEAAQRAAERQSSLLVTRNRSRLHAELCPHVIANGVASTSVSHRARAPDGHARCTLLGDDLGVAIEAGVRALDGFGAENASAIDALAEARDRRLLLHGDELARGRLLGYEQEHGVGSDVDRRGAHAK